MEIVPYKGLQSYKNQLSMISKSKVNLKREGEDGKGTKIVFISPHILDIHKKTHAK